MSERRFLVTGARGFIGSWVTKHLVDRGFAVTAFDIDDRSDRLSLLLRPAGLENTRFVRGDINEPGLIENALREGAITHVIHTAGLQTPECRDRPIAGATVNVLGTLAVFEAVRACRDQVACVVYASSGAVLGVDPPAARPFTDDEPMNPQTLYGAFKAANEQCARVYWQDEGIRSVGLRPPVVYGFGRDRGLTRGHHAGHPGSDARPVLRNRLLGPGERRVCRRRGAVLRGLCLEGTGRGAGVQHARRGPRGAGHDRCDRSRCSLRPGA